jgi:hypothetical protein
MIRNNFLLEYQALPASPSDSQQLRERERERKLGVVVRDTTIVDGVGNNIFGLKVPRHCPLVRLIRVRLEFRINSTFFILMLMELEELHWNEM